MINTSGLEPRGCAVLIQAYEPERKGALIALPESVQSKVSMVDIRATVIATGPSAWADESEPRAVPGDRVLVTKFAGMMAVGPQDGKPYRLVNDRDVFCRITAEEAA
tara:strand:- start:1029 stop:1349 length:321 start_codon:yes stop_codon:yes gene_type:complete